ncbi:MAG: hypothetical protein JJT78_16785 [Leptospira sp.]|nr:hypothetical protein [Leptospira sp.]
MYKYLILFTIFTSIFFSQSLISESYSSHRLDDGLYWNGGSRSEKLESRFHSIPNLEFENEGSLLYGWDFYLPFRHRTQKGGLEEDLETGYLSQIQFTPELYLGYLGKEFKTYLIIAPLVSYREDRILERDIDRILDTELIIGLQLFQDKIYIQGGRGFQRIDRYGFLMNSFMNFIEVGIKFNLKKGWIGIEALGGNWNDTYQSLSPSHWNADRYNTHGISLKGSVFEDTFKWNLFTHRIMKRPQFPQRNSSFFFGEDFVYNGLEVTIDPKILYTKLELGGISMNGNLDTYLPSSFTINDTKKYQNSILYYGKITLEPQFLTFELNGLYETKSGWQPMKQESRFMGGQGSILLNLSTYRNTDRYSDERLESAGIYLGRDWSIFGDQKFKLGIFYNQAFSYFGKGNEAILQMGWMDSRSNFVFISSAYAVIDPQRLGGNFIEELRTELPNRDYLRFFITAGLRF